MSSTTEEGGGAPSSLSLLTSPPKKDTDPVVAGNDEIKEAVQCEKSSSNEDDDKEEEIDTIPKRNLLNELENAPIASSDEDELPQQTDRNAPSASSSSRTTKMSAKRNNGVKVNFRNRSALKKAAEALEVVTLNSEEDEEMHAEMQQDDMVSHASRCRCISCGGKSFVSIHASFCRCRNCRVEATHSVS